MVTIQPGRADTRYGRNWCVCVGRWELVQGVFSGCGEAHENMPGEEDYRVG